MFRLRVTFCFEEIVRLGKITSPIFLNLSPLCLVNEINVPSSVNAWEKTALLTVYTVYLLGKDARTIHG